MKNTNAFLPAIASFCLFALFAFTEPARLQEQFLTVFYPDESRPVAAVHHSPLSTHHSVQDTFEPLQERLGSFLNPSPNPIDLKDPKVVEQGVEYDPVTGQYIITEKIGDDYFRAPTYMTFNEYAKWKEQKQQQEYFDRLQGVSEGKGKGSGGGISDPVAKFDVKNTLIDRLFGGTTVDIRPQGNINLTFGFDYQKILNPILTRRQQSNGNFDFDMDINIGARGKVGEKLNLDFNYNTQATFDFDNQMKLNYDTKNFSEDEILQNIEAGNVSMPLRSQLIKGSPNLFGIKAEMKFGHLRLTTVASQQRSRQNNLTLQGGAQVQQFQVPIDEYDENRHFFVSHYNRETFEPSLRCLPVPMNLFRITRMEVWLTNDQLRTENVRDIVALADLGEPQPANPGIDPTPGAPTDINLKTLPANGANDLYPRLVTDLQADSTLRFSDKIVQKLQTNYGLRQIRDFEKQRCRLLSPQEYTYHDQLGFVSINLNVQPDQIVGVALEYSYNGKPYKIGEFTSDFQNGDTLNQNALFVKMLKSTTANVNLPIWDLMMKNVYAIGTANLDPQEFRFDIYYEDPGAGQKRFLNGPGIPQALNSKPLLQVFRLDTLNLQQDPGPDGIFDFVPGLTVNLRSGRVMFPVLEPFGKFLSDRLTEAGADTNFTKNLVYPQLYDSTLFRAREFQHLNRFTLKGSYKSASNAEISLGTFNLPQGSVRVSAGGRQLVEGQDYEVDYNIGKIKILNDAILQSGQNVNVSFEDNALFGFNSRTMLGVRADYDLNKDVKLGATFMNLFERPLTQKVNFGDDPINNKMYGLDASISKEAPFLTKLVDKLPFYSTKEPSTIQIQAEGAVLDPGHARAINQGEGGGGIVYMDDFEGSTSGIPLTNPANGWVLASTPSRDNQDWISYPEADSLNTVLTGVNRARMSWYIADPFARDNADATNPYTRPLQYNDLFPNRQLTPLEQSNLRPLDVTVYPRERGPYNFDIPDGYPGFSTGLNSEGLLRDPQTRWAGFMRGLNTNDFEAANIEFVEFWMLNPYMEKGDGTPVSESGEIFIDLGSINEDLMRDSRQFFENAIPTDGNGASATTAWGRVPVLPPVVIAFDNDPAKRAQQDVGFDGLDDEAERLFYKNYIDAITAAPLSNAFKQEVQNDPSNDNFVYFRDPIFDGQNPGLLERYRKFNSPQGNSPVNQTQNLNPSATNQPDIEDLNRDNSLNETEAFFRYRIQLKKAPLGDSLDISDPTLANLITDRMSYTESGVAQPFIWYRFKIPLDAGGNVRTTVGGIQDFRSIRFVRTTFKGFTERTTFRFATFELGRNQWRRFTQRLSNPADSTCISDATKPDPSTSFDVNSVSIEENAARVPFNYTIPFGVQREQSVGAFPDVLQNEQSLSMEFCDLKPCDDRAIFKTLNMDLRQFKRLKMFVHLEETQPVQFPLDSGKLAVFVRLGSDFYRNYYEYEVPISPSEITNIMGLSADSRAYKEEVWRPSNSVDFPLELLTEIKKSRNATGQTAEVFAMPDPDNPTHIVKVVGNPNLGYVKGVMVGVRNIDPDRQPQCGEVWINELRLNGFNEKGGYAGLARVDMKLADLGNVSFSTNYTSIGWGSIEQKLIQRQREEVIAYDFSTNVELGKFLPQKSGLRIPFYYQYSNTTRNPEFDPYDLDIKLKDKLRSTASAAERDSIRAGAQDVTINRGYNFTNVRKERTGGKTGKPWPWAIENFSLTYAYNNQLKRTPFISRDDQKQYKGGLDYTYSTGLKPIMPFKKLIKKDKYLKFLSEFNFNPIPNNYGFTTTLERFFNTTTYRFVDEAANADLNTFFNKRFTWDRNYDLGWDLSKSLKFDYDATARSIIDEPQERNLDGSRITSEFRRDSILTNLRNLGRPKNFQQNVGLTWTLPFKTIPFMDWVTVKASYTGGYTWTAASLKMQYLDPAGTPDALRNLGHVIQNKSTRQINGDFNLETLYNKNKYLSKINKPAKKGASGNKKDKKADKNAPTGKDDAGSEPDGSTLGPGGKGQENDEDSTRPNARARDSRRSPEEEPKDPASQRNPTPLGPDGKPLPPGKDAKDKADDKNSKDKNSKEKEDKAKGAKGSKPANREPSIAERIAIRPLMMMRKARFTYSENYGSVIPGFLPETKLFGQNDGFTAPGWAYVVGFQPDNKFLDELAASGHYTHRTELNQEATRTYTQNLDAGVTIEPFADFRIELTAQRQYSRNNSQLFKDQNFINHLDSVNFEHRAERDMGSFTTSFFAMNTLFNGDINGLFQRYQSYRAIISERLGVAAGNTGQHEQDGKEYKYGYGRIQQQVLIPAFIAAYSESDPNTTQLDVFKTRPAVNWKLNYNGLSKIGNLKKVFQSVQISHGYKNTLQVNSYNTDIFFDPAAQYTTDPLNGNYIARYEIPQIVINEQMQPLLGVDVKLKNDMSFKVDMKKSRTLAMSFIDYQLAESRSTGYTLGFGYRMKNVNIPFLTGKKTKKTTAKTKKPKPGETPAKPDDKAGGKKPQGNDMNFKFDFDYRDDITVNHRLDQTDEAVPTRGTRTITISPAVDYALNRRLKLRVFCDYRKTTPKTSASFPITNINAGVTVQFTLN